MPIIKRCCAFFLVLVLLVPAISIQDDAISLAALTAIDGSGDDSVTAIRHLSKSEFDPTLATLLDRFETLQVASACVLHVEISSTPYHPFETSVRCNCDVTAPVGRAPPGAQV